MRRAVLVLCVVLAVAAAHAGTGWRNMNYLTNNAFPSPGFESATFWTDVIRFERTMAQQHTGSWSGELESVITVQRIIPPEAKLNHAIVRSDAFDTLTATDVTLQAWVRPNNARLTVPGSLHYLIAEYVSALSPFTWTEIGRREVSTLSDGWHEVDFGSFVPLIGAGGLQQIRFRSLGAGGDPDLGEGYVAGFEAFDGAGDPIPSFHYWYIDDVSVQDTAEVEMAVKRREIMAAVVSTLGNITVANGHAVEVNSVTEGYVSPQNVSDYPTIQVIYGPETKKFLELHRKKNIIRLELLIMTKADATLTEEEQADEIAGSAEIVLETFTAGMYLSLGYVEEVEVAEIDPYQVDPAVSSDTAVWRVGVDVTYRHDRLSP